MQHPRGLDDRWEEFLTVHDLFELARALGVDGVPDETFLEDEVSLAEQDPRFGRGVLPSNLRRDVP